jgi:hypothetical protein
MKKLIALVLLCMSYSLSNAQIVRTQYDSLQDKKMELIQIRLEKFNKQFYTGASLWYVGLMITALSAQSSRDGNTMLFTGLGINTLGSIIMIASHKQIGRAGKVRRNKLLNEY